MNMFLEYLVIAQALVLYTINIYTGVHRNTVTVKGQEVGDVAAQKSLINSSAFSFKEVNLRRGIDWCDGPVGSCVFLTPKVCPEVSPN